MDSKTKLLVIRTIKCSDKSLIVTCFTQRNGIKTYFVKDVFSSRKNRQRAAYFQPLNILEVVENYKTKNKLEILKEVSMAYQYQTVGVDIVKSTMILFLSEILYYSIKSEEENEPLFSYLETACIWLDTHHDIVNTHLIIFMGITKYLGFFPNIDTIQNRYFDLSEGLFVNHQDVNTLNAEQTMLLKTLLKLRLDNDTNVFRVTERQELLKIIIDYYMFHIDGFRKLKSIEVLKEVYS